ncbi:hypothetical protein XH96_33130 [Bradyrhizobium sp. CCBAU 51765]|nr:hypothetical protein XH96_33130 [Bradyrhizobium sp. CCBAU 51765]
MVSSGRSIASVAKELGLRDSVLRRWVDISAGADIGGVASHHAGDADVGGPGLGDRPAAPGERTAAHGARHFKKTITGPSPPVRGRNGQRRWYLLDLEGSGHHLIGGTVPVKKRGPWVQCGLENGDAVRTAIPIRKMTIGITQSLQPHYWTEELQCRRRLAVPSRS